MKGKTLLLILSLVAATVGECLGFPKIASASEVCNYRNRTVYMAQAYPNRNEIWVSEGWWELEPGECIVYSDRALAYVKLDRHSPSLLPYDRGFPDTDLCIVHDRFIVYNAIEPSACREAGGTMKTFIGIGPGQELIK